jgi:hypothetical protein
MRNLGSAKAQNKVLENSFSWWNECMTSGLKLRSRQKRQAAGGKKKKEQAHQTNKILTSDQSDS